MYFGGGNKPTRCNELFKPGACGLRLHMPGFLKLLWFACRYMCVCVCLCVHPEGINNQWHDMV